jgi:HEPN domain-containing protein
VNRNDLQTLADLRVEDAKVLIGSGRFSAAYYLLGYAVECALKACVTKQIKEHDFPDKKLVLDSYTHDLEQLLRISGVKPQFDQRIKGDRSFEVSWTTVKDWTESARYDNNVPEIKARDLLNAVTDAKSGVLAWLKTLW